MYSNLFTENVKVLNTVQEYKNDTASSHYFKYWLELPNSNVGHLQDIQSDRELL